MIFHRPEFFIPKSFFANLAKRAAICIVQFHICDFKRWGLQNAVLKSFLVFLGPVQCLAPLALGPEIVRLGHVYKHPHQPLWR